ncbi:uncharacterized protein LOC135814814 [Sycon ciliatum]|uniref:uncharacterized protein LOC135814814 n=1 Tax=Sycon ciliatum TaxID=27933 RepID=UPI0020AD4A69|eukprot:scpid81157/ scgid17645/ 
MEVILRKGRCSFGLWPLYAKIFVAVCIVCGLVGLILLIAGASKDGTGIVVAGAVLLALVTVIVLIVLLWMARVYMRQSFSPQQTAHTDLPDTDYALRSRGVSAQAVLPGPSQTSSRSVLPTAGEDASSSGVLLYNLTRKESNSTIASNGAADFWGKGASLQRLPTASTLQMAMEGEGADGLLRLTDFQTSSQDDNTSLALTRQSCSTPELQSAHHSRHTSQRGLDGADDFSGPSRLSTLSEKVSPERQALSEAAVAGTALPKSVSSSYIHVSHEPSRRRPHSSVSGVASEVDASALEAASQRLAREQSQSGETQRQLSLSSADKSSKESLGDIVPVSSDTGEVFEKS